LLFFGYLLSTRHAPRPQGMGGAPVR